MKLLIIVLFVAFTFPPAMAWNNIVGCGSTGKITNQPCLPGGEVPISVLCRGGSIVRDRNTLCGEESSTQKTVGTGLFAQYFSGINFETLITTTIDPQVDYDWGGGAAPHGYSDSFSVRWSGKIKGKVTGPCYFYTLSDDGVRLYFNGSAVISNWTLHGPTWNSSGAINFTPGTFYPITMEFYENGGGATAKLWWYCPSSSIWEAIPKEYLFPQ